MFFKRKSKLLLPEGTNLRGKIRPEKKMRLYGENDDIENEEEQQPWWVLSSDEKETIEKANIYFAEKHKSINGNGKKKRMLLRITMKNTNGFDRKDVFNYFEENPIY